MWGNFPSSYDASGKAGREGRGRRQPQGHRENGKVQTTVSHPAGWRLEEDFEALLTLICFKFSHDRPKQSRNCCGGLWDYLGCAK